MASFAQAERYSPPASVSSPSSSTPRPEDTAVLMRANGRGRGRRMRVISKAKLPRMNNSERGKFYRQKYREYEEQLERDVQRLHGEVHELQRLLELRQLLPHQYPCVGPDEVRAATQIVYEGLVRLHERWASIERGSESPAAGLVADEIRCAERVQRLQLCPSQAEHFVARHQNSSTPLMFNLESVEIQGCSDSRIVVAHGRLYAHYQPADLETLFPVIRHNKHLAARLLAREVAYSCTYRFHTSEPFGVGELAFVSVDVDAVGGLLAAIPNLQCVEALLTPLIYSECADVKVEVNITTGPRIGSNCYDSPPPPTAAGSALREHYSSSSQATPPRAMELAFILS